MKTTFATWTAMAAAALWLTASPVSFAAGEIQATAPTGRTLYAEVINGSGAVWQTGNTFAAISNTTLVAQTVPMTEQGTTGIYLGSFPATITGAGTYLALVYTRSGASAAVGDVLTGNGSLDWTGTALASVGASANILATVNTTTTSTNALATGINTQISTIANHQMGRFRYTPATHVLQLYLDDGTTLFGSALTLTLDGSNNILQR